MAVEQGTKELRLIYMEKTGSGDGSQRRSESSGRQPGVLVEVRRSWFRRGG